MVKNPPSSLALRFSLGVSAFGLLTTLMLTLLPPTPIENLPWRKPLIGIMFIVICISGGVASLFPRKCSEQFDLQRDERSRTSNRNKNDTNLTVKGHHPNCREFSAHVIQAKGHTLCAACTGLLLGALIAVVGAVLYFFLGWELQLPTYLIVQMGMISVVVGFFQLKFKGAIRSTLNALFVVGAYFVLAGMDMLSRNVFLDIYLIGLVLLWIWTRILLSERDHTRTCQNCKLDCELKQETGTIIYGEARTLHLRSSICRRLLSQRARHSNL